MPSPYERGRSAEYWVKRMLEDKGYFVIRKEEGSSPSRPYRQHTFPPPAQALNTDKLIKNANKKKWGVNL